jgi:hypothetical protein
MPFSLPDCNRRVLHESFGRGTVPMLFAGRTKHDVTGYN